MVFHRTAKIGSLVNPQLDDFRKVMFTPALYTLWEALMVTTGLQNNQLFPTALLSLVIVIASSLYTAVTSSSSESLIMAPVTILPLLVGIWGATLFKSTSDGKMRGAGFASKTYGNGTKAVTNASKIQSRLRR